MQLPHSSLSEYMSNVAINSSQRCDYEIANRILSLLDCFVIANKSLASRVKFHQTFHFTSYCTDTCIIDRQSSKSAVCRVDIHAATGAECMKWTDATCNGVTAIGNVRCGTDHNDTSCV